MECENDLLYGQSPLPILANPWQSSRQHVCFAVWYESWWLQYSSN